MAATRTKRPKKKPKLRGGTNQPAEPIEMPGVEGLLGSPPDDGWPDGKAYVDGVNIDEPIPLVPAESNGHVGTIADAVDLVIEKAEEHAPVNRLTEALAYDSPGRR